MFDENNFSIDTISKVNSMKNYQTSSYNANIFPLDISYLKVTHTPFSRSAHIFLAPVSFFSSYFSFPYALSSSVSYMT